MRTFPFIFISLHSSNSSIPLLYKDSHPDYPHLYTHFLAFPPHSLHHHPYSPHPTLISRIPIIPTLIPTHSHPDPHIPTIPTLILRIPIIPTLFPRIPIIPLIPFPDSPFRLLQIARSLCFVSEIVSQSCYICINCLIQIWVTNIVNVI